MNERRWWWFLLALALAAIFLEVQWTHSIAWDEVEFFRATRWIAEGRVPYRDFWEHHLPLQWLLFAPVAIPLSGTGVAVLLWMRWLQLPLWIALFAIGAHVLRNATSSQRWLALLLLLGSRFFYTAALEYRVDTAGSLFYVAAVALAWMLPRSSRAWTGFGALMSCAVLANMRLAPLAACTAIVLAFIDGEERRWRWNPRAWWMSIGIAAAAIVFLGGLAATHAFAPFVEAMRSNIAMDRLLSTEAHTFWPLVGSAFRDLDLGAIAMWILFLAGGAMALRDIRRPALPQLLTILALISIALVGTLGVHYVYHFELSFLLMAPVAAGVLTQKRFEPAAMIGVALILAVNLGARLNPNVHRIMDVQDFVMHEVDRVTRPDEKVWEGVGYALHREPAYKYWFLPAGIRMLAIKGEIERYDAEQMIADPPGAIIYNARVHFWLQSFPNASRYATRHYVPLHRNLWIPGLTALLQPRVAVQWIVPKSGHYRVYASEILAKHPWFTHPLQYGLVAGPDASLYELRIDRLPLMPDGVLHLAVDGVPVATNRTLQLRRGSVVSAESAAPIPIGVMIVPDNEKTFFITPEERLY